MTRTWNGGRGLRAFSSRASPGRRSPNSAPEIPSSKLHVPLGEGPTLASGVGAGARDLALDPLTLVVGAGLSCALAAIDGDDHRIAPMTWPIPWRTKPIISR